MEFRKEGQSEWDMRQAFLERLHKAITNCNQAIYLNNYEYWYKSLCVLQLELSSHLRNEEEEEMVNSSMEKATSILYDRINSIAKFRVFMNAQKALHKIMRLRGFDIPITDRSPGSALRNSR